MPRLPTDQVSSLSPKVSQVFGATGVALFDLDRTLLPGSSLAHLGRALVRRRLVRRRQLAVALARNLAFARRGAGDGTALRLQRGLLGAAAGVEQQAVLDAVADVTPEIVAAVYPMARWLIDDHVEAGDFCVLVSAAPQELVESVADALGMHRAVGTTAEVVDGRYTGHLAGPFCYGTGKVTRLRSEVGALERMRSVAYADSASDIPLLQSCDQPVAVNPDRRLLAVSNAAGWPVLRFVT